MRTDSRIDVAALQKQIEQYARERGADPPFPQLELRRLGPVLREAVMVDPNPLLVGRTRYERMWVVINRVVRQVIRHAFEPVVRRQNAWNSGTHDAIRQLATLDDGLRAEVVRLHAESRHDHA